MLERIANRFNIDLAGVPAVGDSLRDLQAAACVGALPCLVRTGKGHKTESEGNLPDGTRIYADLAEVVDNLLSTS